ncbi:MAG: hypothetical protein K2W78_16525 [Xanthobacteraceae bacterium]|nr:hypothetical protein [Xanthobacteraceae bacterium]
MRNIFAVAIFASAFVSVGSSAFAGCVDPAASPEAIAQFKSNPANLASPQADARAVEALTRDLAATDAKLAADLVRVAGDARPQIQTAIAAGLAQAAVACTNIDREAVQLIQEAVASVQNGQFQASFAAISGDLSTAATAAAAGAAAAGAGSVVINNPVSSPTNVSNVPQGTKTNFTNTLFAIATPTVNTPVGTTAADPISPVQ